jgi:hypothetical protein
MSLSSWLARQQTLTRPQWISREKFRRTQAPTAFPLQVQHAQAVRAAANHNAVSIRRQNFSGWTGGWFDLCLPEFQQLRLKARMRFQIALAA